MKMICKQLSGSKAYGLDTPSSDTDYRGVFINTDPLQILGVKKMEHYTDPNEEDALYYELRHFLNLVKAGNTTALEILFNPDDILSKLLTNGRLWAYIRINRWYLFDTKAAYKAISGYAFHEKKTAFGITTGKLGEKRKKEIEQYGFCPKNYVQAIRLLVAGHDLIKYGELPIKVSDIREYLLKIKTRPEEFKAEKLMKDFDFWVNLLDGIWEEMKNEPYHRYSEEAVKSILVKAYKEFI